MFTYWESSQVLRTPRAARMEPDPRDPTTDNQSILVAVCRQRLREAAKVQWKLSWETNPHGKHLRRILTAPAKAHLDLHCGLRRAASSVIVQLQTGKIALAGTECPCVDKMPTTSSPAALRT
jgi:hypothetical protein